MSIAEQKGLLYCIVALAFTSPAYEQSAVEPFLEDSDCSDGILN